MRGGEGLSGGAGRAWTPAAPQTFVGLVDNVAPAEELTLKRKLAEAPDFCIGRKRTDAVIYVHTIQVFCCD